MTAARLRAAADQIDRGWDLAQRRISPMVAESWGVITDVDRRTAALLRAVADDVEIGLYIVGAESPAAALALADVILGGAE